MVEGYVYYILSAIAVIMMTGPILKGMRLTMDFLSSLSKSKKHDSIDRYNDLHGRRRVQGLVPHSDSNFEIKSMQILSRLIMILQRSSMSGDGVHPFILNKRKGETFKTVILRHEHFLAGRLGSPRVPRFWTADVVWVDPQETSHVLRVLMSLV